MQYVLHLGIFDVVDIVVDMLGFSVGYLALSILSDIGFCIVLDSDKKHARIDCPQKKEREAGKEIKEEGRSLKSTAILVSTFVGVFVLVLAIGFVFYDYREYVAPLPMTTTTDETLNKLPLKAHTPDEIDSLVENMTFFKVNGQQSSADWIETDGMGKFKANGGIASYDTWLDESGTQFFGISLGVRENLNGVTVTHGLPLIVVPQTKVFLSGKQLDLIDLTDDLLSEYFRYGVEAEFSLQEGWFKVESLTFTPYKDDQEVPYVWFDFYKLTETTRGIKEPQKDFLFEVYSDRRTLIEGYIDIVHENVDSDNYFTVRLNSKIGDALVCHTVEVYFEDKVPDGFIDKMSAGSSPVTSEVYVEGGRIVYSME